MTPTSPSPPRPRRREHAPRLALAALALLAPPLAAEEKPELVIYTYDSFTSEWGPGPAIAKNFEATCDCTVRFVGAGDGAALLGAAEARGQRAARPTSCSGSTPT